MACTCKCISGTDKLNAVFYFFNHFKLPCRPGFPLRHHNNSHTILKYKKSTSGEITKDSKGIRNSGTNHARVNSVFEIIYYQVSVSGSPVCRHWHNYAAAESCCEELGGGGQNY